MNLDDVIKEGRNWLVTDAGYFRGHALSDIQVVLRVHFSYPDGWSCFVRDKGADERVVFDECERRYPIGVVDELYPDGYAQLSIKCCVWLPYPSMNVSPECPVCHSTFHLKIGPGDQSVAEKR